MPIRDIAPRDGGLLTYEFIDGFPFFIGEESPTMPRHKNGPSLFWRRAVFRSAKVTVQNQSRRWGGHLK